MQFSPTSHHVIPLRSKYSPQHPVLKHPQSMFLPECQTPSSTPIQNHRQTFTLLDSRREDKRFRTKSPYMFKNTRRTRHLIAGCDTLLHKAAQAAHAALMRTNEPQSLGNPHVAMCSGFSTPQVETDPKA
jgi:hypothetical protein